MKSTVRGNFRSEILPPTEGAAEQRILRSYLQYSVWHQLKSLSSDPLRFDFELRNGLYIHVGNMEPYVPEKVIRLTCCNLSVPQPPTALPIGVQIEKLA